MSLDASVRSEAEAAWMYGDITSSFALKATRAPNVGASEELQRLPTVKTLSRPAPAFSTSTARSCSDGSPLGSLVIPRKSSGFIPSTTSLPMTIIIVLHRSVPR